MSKVLRKPKVENKYNLTIDKIKKLKIGDRSKICEPLFWRNNVISAWCITDSIGPYFNETSFWIGIYDEDAPSYKGKLRFSFETYGGMCGYNFNTFYNSRTIESDSDLRIQELFLEKVNLLLDEGVLIF